MYYGNTLSKPDMNGVKVVSIPVTISQMVPGPAYCSDWQVRFGSHKHAITYTFKRLTIVGLVYQDDVAWHSP